MAISAWLVIVAVVIVAVCIAANFYLLVYFQHPQDKNVAWFPKIIVVRFSHICRFILRHTIVRF